MTEVFEKLTKRNASAFFEAYMARKDEALECFLSRIEEQGGPTKEILNFSPESLVSLWAWLHTRLQYSDKHPPPEESPMWYDMEIVNNQHSQGIYFPEKTLFWIDGLAYYFGDTIISNLDGVHWSVCEDSKAFHYNKPVISGKSFTYPLNTIINVTGGAIEKLPTNNDGRLLEIFNIMKSDTEK